MTRLLFWGVFAVLVVGFLALDLGVLHRRGGKVTLREAFGWSAVWIALALGFAGALYLWRGGDTALEFLTGYLIEKSLSIDILFVFLLIFGYFRVPERFQHGVLFWGIIGALVMRLALIAVGITLVETFHWLLYVFGAFLVVTGLRLLIRHGRSVERATASSGGISASRCWR